MHRRDRSSDCRHYTPYDEVGERQSRNFRAIGTPRTLAVVLQSRQVSQFRIVFLAIKFPPWPERQPAKVVPVFGVDPLDRRNRRREDLREYAGLLPSLDAGADAH